MGKNITVFLFLLFCVLVFNVLKVHPQTTHQIAALASPSPSAVSTTSAVLDESTSALCHAKLANQSDPQAVLPDPNCTPGVANQNVTQENISSTICKSGYTKTIRPPVSYTNSLKRQQIIDYGFVDTHVSAYEEDHLISLELGGDPKDPKNLWPEPHGSPNEKDKVENYLNEEVCSGAMTLRDAQTKISTNWYEVYKTLSQQ